MPAVDAVDRRRDTALDREPAPLRDCRALVTAGHDEDWTATCHTATEGLVDAGGSMAVFGADTRWWYTEVRDG